MPARTSVMEASDTNKIQEILDLTESNVQYFDTITSGMVEAETKHLDKLMQDVYGDIIQAGEFPMEKLENYYLELTNLLYFMGEKLEKLSVRSDIARAQAKEKYNNAYLANMQKDTEGKNKRTVAENQAVADSASVYESTVQSIYEHVYKVIEYKIDAGYEMVKTISKLITRRMQEIDMSKGPNIKTGFGVDNNKQLLVE